MNNVMVFDIETVPDVENGRRLYELDGLNDADVAKAMRTLRLAKTGHDFLAHHLQRIVAISVVFRHADQIKVWSLGDETSSEQELITRFFDGIDRYEPTLVTWNGSGFDLPVLHYRALLHNVVSPTYWEMGDRDREFRYNNYLSRFHWRHIDLMDVLASYQGRANASLDEIASMLGFPGKHGMDGSMVWDAFQAGKIREIRQYCESDVLNTYLVFLRFERIRARLGEHEHQAEETLLAEMLDAQDGPHLREFLHLWRGAGE